MKNQNLMSCSLRVWLLLGIIVSMSSIVACSPPAIAPPAETPQAEEGFTLNAPYRPDVEVPFQFDEEGRLFLAPLLEEAQTADGEISKADLEEIHLNVTVPPLPFDIQTFTETQVLTATYVEQMSFVLVGPAESAEIVLEIHERLDVDAFHSETVIHGGLDGEMKYEDGSTAEVLFAIAIIPERQRGRFNLTIHPRDNDIPQVSLPFGGLEFTPELTDLVRN